MSSPSNLNAFARSPNQTMAVNEPGEINTVTSREGKRVFLGLSLLSLLLLITALSLLWYLSQPRLAQLDPRLPAAVGLLSAGFMVVIAGGLFLIILSALTEKDLLFPHGGKPITVTILFPIVFIIGRLLGFSKKRIQRSFIEVNNSLVRVMKRRIDGERLLILLPRCLQHSACDQSVIEDVFNCKGCGRCEVAALVELGREYPATIRMATGGSLALKLIADLKPTAVVAVACERELVVGIQESYWIPVLGIINLRPEGPCRNTRVDARQVEAALRFFVDE